MKFRNFALVLLSGACAQLPTVRGPASSSNFSIECYQGAKAILDSPQPSEMLVAQLSDAFETGPRQLVVHRSFSGQYIVEKISTEPLASFTAKVNGQSAKLTPVEASSQYVSSINEYMNFALNEYERRGWPEEFKDRLRADALNFRDRSVWVGLREPKPDGSPGELVATMSLKFAPFQGTAEKNSAVGYRNGIEGAGQLYYEVLGGSATAKPPTLPMEGLFSIELPREAGITWYDESAEDIGFLGFNSYRVIGQGMVVEPTTFAIAKSVGNDAFFELAAEIIGNLKTSLDTPELNRFGKKIFTYGDEVSKRFYERYFGFKRIGQAKMTFCCQDKSWFILSGDVQTALEKFLQRINEAKSLAPLRQAQIRKEIEQMLIQAPR